MEVGEKDREMAQNTTKFIELNTVGVFKRCPFHFT
jgi:hypothetical protein